MIQTAPHLPYPTSSRSKDLDESLAFPLGCDIVFFMYCFGSLWGDSFRDFHWAFTTVNSQPTCLGGVLPTAKYVRYDYTFEV